MGVMGKFSHISFFVILLKLAISLKLYNYQIISSILKNKKTENVDKYKQRVYYSATDSNYS